MGLWSAALMGGGGLGAAFTPWLASHSAAWHDALAWWALPALLALLQLAGDLSAFASRTASDQRFPGSRLLASAAPWTLGLYFGLINAGYASLIAWLPPLLHPARRQRPVQRFAAGAADRRANRRRAAAPGAGSPGGSAPASSASAGATADWLLRLYLAARAFLCALGHCLRRGIGRRVSSVPGAGAGYAGQPAVAGRLVAFMQGIGFIIAGLSPWLSGLLRSLSGNYTLDWSSACDLRPATHGADAALYPGTLPGRVATARLRPALNRRRRVAKIMPRALVGLLRPPHR